MRSCVVFTVSKFAFGICNYVCAYTESSVEAKTEANVTDHTHDDKPRSCLSTMCHQGFTQKGNVNVREPISTGEKPFPCTVCLV